MKILIIISALFSFHSIIYAQVNVEWIHRFNGSANRFDIANSLKLDAGSNAYIYGTTATTNSSTDVVIIKYHSIGPTLWATSFNGYGNSVDQTNGCWLDASGNSYVTGFTADTNQVIKIFTIKCSASGNLLWTRVFLPPAYNQGFGKAVAADNNSNVYTCGYMRRANGSFDIVTIKYSPNGDLIDTAIYNIASSSSEIPVSMCLDNAGNIYILAATNAISGFDDILMLKYNSALNLAWSNIFSGSAVGSDQAIQILYTNDNKLAVCAAMNMAQRGLDYGLYRFDTNSVLIMQYFYNGTGNNQDIPFAIANDNANNIYVTGSSRNADTLGSEDFATLKLSPTGQLLWARRYNGVGAGTDYGISIAVDISGSVYAGGTADKHTNHLAYALLKYNLTGDLQWLEEYSVMYGSEDFIYSVAVDNSYNVFVTGISFDSTSDYDIATIKYSQPIGIIPISGEIPNDFMLGQNYPNPFNPVTKIRFSIPTVETHSIVSLRIYDMLGREVKALVNQPLNPGIYEIDWDASAYPSGVYFYTLISYNNSITKKMILIK